MDIALPAVAQALTLEVIAADGALISIQAELSYDPAAPYAVTTVFATSPEKLTWTFGRELLCEGVQAPSGSGDVHVWPCLDIDRRPVVMIELCPPGGGALIQVRTDDLVRFIKQMTDVVPLGRESEQLDIDGTILALLDTTHGS
ncbi:MAG: SsgA family sporulation/cell division regulator [Actinomycetota bacterium]|nr:SsgA family sporulation/cell division regulator [Actinomycetota bacterium]